MKSIALSLLLAASLHGQTAPDPFSTTAPDPGEKPGPSVQITVEFIEVSQVEATRILYKERLGKDGEKLRAELQKLADEGKGAVVETMAISTLSGQQATVESILEMIYPTEYDPPEIPSSVTLDKETTATPEKVAVLESMMTPATPTSFETRNTGNTLEIAPTVSEDGKSIHLRFIPEMVFYTGNTVFQRRKDPLGNESTVEMPLFYSMRMSTSMKLDDGRSQLAGVLSPKSATGVVDGTKKVFAMVRGDIVKATPAK